MTDDIGETLHIKKKVNEERNVKVRMLKKLRKEEMKEMKEIKERRKWFKKGKAVLLAMALLLFQGMPAMVQAASTATVKNINLGTVGLANTGSKVYFGLDTSSTIPKVNADNSITVTSVYTKTTANNLWRVLDASSGLLFADDIIAERRYDDDYNDWNSSELKSWLNGNTYKTNNYKFTKIEQGAIAKNPDGDMRLLTIDEVKKTEYGFSNNHDNNDKRAASACWWLRSPGYNDDRAAVVNDDGSIYALGSDVRNVYYVRGLVRPAFNLKLDSVLFSSASSAGKSSFGSVGTDKVSDNTWKLTLKDSSKTVSVTNGKSVSRSGQNVTVPYTYTGKDVSQISIMITDKAYTESDASILYYGALNTTLATTGTGTFILPTNLPEQYKIYMMAEDVKDGKLTDYSSEPVEISAPTLINSVEVTGIDAPKAGQAFDTKAACATTGVESTAPEVTWKKGEEVVTGKAGYNTTYTASVTLAAAKNYEFAPEVTATVNGKAAQVTKNADQTLTVTYSFTKTAKDKLIEIINPPRIEVDNGTSKEVIKENLPKKVMIKTVGYILKTADVAWDMDSVSYNSKIFEQQEIQVNGTVSCPQEIDSNNVELKTKINVTIKEAAIVGPTITAKEKTVRTEVAKTIPNKEALGGSNYLDVQVKDKYGRSVQPSGVSVQDLDKIKSGETGSYPVTFTYQDPSGKVVTVTKNLTIHTTPTITASDATLSSTEARKNIESSKSLAQYLSPSVTNVMGEACEPTIVKAELTKIKNGEEGNYPVTYEYTYTDETKDSPEDKTISTTVTLNITNSTAISAKDKTVLDTEAQAYTDKEELKGVMGAEVTKDDGNKAESSEIKTEISDSDWDKLKSGETGSYPVTFTYQDPSGKVVTVTKNLTIHTTPTITASDATLSSTEARKNIESSKSLAQYLSPSVTNVMGEACEPTIVKAELTKIKNGEEGNYPVTYEYTYTDETKDSPEDKTISTTVTLNITNSTAISAKDKTVLDTEAQAYTDKEELKGVMGAEVTKDDGNKAESSEIKTEISDSDWDKLKSGETGSYPVTFTYQDPSGKVVTVTKNLTIHTTPTITASDATLSSTEARKNIESSKSLAQYLSPSVTNVMGEACEPTIVKAELTKIKNGEEGNYPVTYEYTYTDETKDSPEDKTISTTVTLNITNSTAISAKDKTVLDTEAQAYTDKEELKGVMGAEVTKDDGNKAESSEIKTEISDSDWDKLKSGETGSYPVTFTYQDPSGKVVTVTKNLTIHTTPTITASDATLSSTEARKNIESSKSLAQYLSPSVTNVMGEACEPTIVKAELTKIKNGEEGNYPVTYEYTYTDETKDSPEDKTISTTVTLNITNSTAISAKDKTVLDTEAQAYTDKEELKGVMGAEVTKDDGNKAESSEIKTEISDSDWDKLKSGETGSYPVTFTYQDPSGKVVTVTKNLTIHTTPTITASDATLSSTEARKNIESSKSLAQYLSPSVTNVMGEACEPTIVKAELTKIKNGEEGNYPVTYEYTYTDETKDSPEDKTISTTVTLNITNSTAISAKDKTVLDTEAQAYTDKEELKGVMGAEVTKDDGNKAESSEIKTEISDSDWDKLKSGETGSYPVTFTYQDPSGKVVTVTKNLTIHTTPTITASDATLSSTEARKNIESSKSLAQYLSPSVTNVMGEACEPTIVKAELTKIKNGEEGNYPVTYEYTYTDETKDSPEDKTISTTVTLNITNSTAISAKDKTVLDTEAQAYTDKEELKGVMGAEVTKDDGNKAESSEIKTEISDSDWDKLKSGETGSYPVTFTYQDPSGKVVTVTKNLTIHTTPTITASDATLSSTEARKNIESSKSLAQYLSPSVTNVMGEACEPTIVKAELTKIKNGEEGNCPVTYEYTYTDETKDSPEDKTISTTVTLNITNSTAISAKDKTVLDTEAQAYTDKEELKGVMGAEVTKDDGNKAESSEIKTEISDSDWDKLKSGETGSYPVTFTYQDPSGKVVTVTKNLTIHTTPTITASDATLSSTEARKNIESSKSLAQYLSPSVTNVMGEACEPTIVKAELTKIKNGEEGNYPVTYEYTYTDETKDSPEDKTISTTVTLNITNSTAISAKDKTVLDTEAQAYTDKEELKGVMGAEVTKDDGNKAESSEIKTEISDSDWDKLKSGETGSYPVTFTYQDPSGKVVTVTKNLTIKEAEKAVKPIIMGPPFTGDSMNVLTQLLAICITVGFICLIAVLRRRRK